MILFVFKDHLVRERMPREWPRAASLSVIDDPFTPPGGWLYLIIVLNLFSAEYVHL